ncbi:MAG: hypothetical protein AMJ81_13690 [Phycisphaerae bacterium SM23_33]|nr:MAG: hypothetical protein AMJ81_13690 [Phycisphaerae bacterium SM23_33]
MRLLAQRGEYDKVKRIALADLWKDISKPETLRHLVVALEKLNDREQAGAFCHILLRVLEQPKTATAPATPAMKKWAEAQLPRLDVEFNRARQQYATSAPAKKFTTPEAVGELWMTNVQADPQCLHGLVAWKLVGGRKNMKPDWIHNRQGRMHRSCLKLMDEVDGRKGVLHAISVNPASKSPDRKFLAAQIERLGHRPRITTRNVGKCKFLRAGVKAQRFPLILRVEAEGKELLSQRVGAGSWSDLKIDLQTSAGKDVPVIVELLVPPGQRPHMGGWIDYLDFFDN